jgi:hypothetical protein
MPCFKIKKKRKKEEYEGDIHTQKLIAPAPAHICTNTAIPFIGLKFSPFLFSPHPLAPATPLSESTWTEQLRILLSEHKPLVFSLPRLSSEGLTMFSNEG